MRQTIVDTISGQPCGFLEGGKLSGATPHVQGLFDEWAEDPTVLVSVPDGADERTMKADVSLEEALFGSGYILREAP